MARFFYTVALFLLLPYVWLHLLWRGRRQPEYLRHIGERFGFYGKKNKGKNKPIIWLHAVSVGETMAAKPLFTAISEHYPNHQILITHMTPTGRQTSTQLFGDSVTRVYLPYDYPFAVRRFLAHFKPVVGLILETELWPNLVATCHDQAVPVFLVNARLSAKSARGYQRFSALSRPALQHLAGIAAQTPEDANRLRELGAQNVAVFGNIKFDLVPPPQQLALGEKLRESIRQRPIFLAASTREGEEALILNALKAHPFNSNSNIGNIGNIGNIKNTLLIIVPRHPQRFDEVAKLIEKHGLCLQRRSNNQPIDDSTQVLLGDSMGEMFAYYTACDVAFIGGSLLDFGGQNLIEACAVGTPVLIGPSTYNFSAAAEQAIACGAAQRVGDAAELLEVAGKLLSNKQQQATMGEAGEAFAVRHRGATAKTLGLISPAIY